MAFVLIADDEQEIRATLRFLLEDAGHTVIEAEDGMAALSLLRTMPQRAVVLLDLVMPRMSGVEVIDTVMREPELLARHAFVLVTASNPKTERPQLAELLDQVPAQMVLKPFDIDVMLDTVERAALLLTPDAS